MGHLDSTSESNFRLHVSMITLATLAVSLRFFARVITKLPYAADDWWILLSLVFYLTNMSLGIAILYSNYSSPLTPLPQLIRALRIIFAATPISISVTATSKISILCLYRRLFPVESFRRKSLVVGAVVVAWWIAAALGAILQCIPVKAAYEIPSVGRCMNFAAYFLGLELVNCLLDIVMLCLPLGVIRGLQMPVQRKIQVSAIFVLGGMVLIAGIVRMTQVYRANSTKLSPNGNVVWASIENGFSIICACLPTYGPLLSKGPVLISNVNSWYCSLLSGVGRGRESAGSKKQSSAQVSGDRRRDHYSHIEDPAHDMTHLTKAWAGAGVNDSSAVREYPLDSFKTKKTNEMV